MAKIIKQYTTNILDEDHKIYQLGVQATPGSTLYINNTNNPIVIGPSGIFQVELEDGSYISTVKVNSSNTFYIDVIEESIEE